MLLGRVAVGDDAGACLQGRDAIAQLDRAQRNARVERAVRTEVADCAGVRAAAALSRRWPCALALVRRVL